MRLGCSAVNATQRGHVLIGLWLLLRRRPVDASELAHRQQVLAQTQAIGQRVEGVRHIQVSAVGRYIRWIIESRVSARTINIPSSAALRRRGLGLEASQPLVVRALVHSLEQEGREIALAGVGPSKRKSAFTSLSLTTAV